MITKEQLRAARKAAGYSVKETAAYMGISAATFYGYENGKAGIPETRQEQIRELFDISDESADRYPETKTEEGYPDPTAAEALKVEHKKVVINAPQVGKIYEIPTKDKNKSRAILVMGIYGKHIMGCMVYIRPYLCDWPDLTYTTGRFVIDISEVRRFTTGSLDMHRYFDLPEMWKDFNKIKGKIAARFGLPVVEVKEVEKIVEVEKPVERSVDDPLKDAVYMVYNDMMNRLGGKNVCPESK